jgi:predicted short-subunit dehydrogenase-like oxidoreductase (DUF2520 family)
MKDVEVSIVGAGRTGRTLGRLLREAGWRLGPVWSRSRRRAGEACAFMGGGRPTTRPEGAGLTLLCVPDEALPELARSVEMPGGGILAHVCASLGAEALRPWRPAGALHPLRSFADPARAAAAFRGTACAIDGDPAAVRVLRAATRAMGGVPLRVRPGRKPLYHAGAVFASNYVVAAVDAGLGLLERAGLDRREGLRALLPLLRGTVDAIESCGIPGALTGPVERGDSDTVARHVGALATRAPGLSRLYAELGRATLRVARAKGSIGAAEARRLGRLLR